ncbi:MAG: thiamine pyrophosphate-binding protein [Phycisphaerae bacterium]
MKVSDYVWDHLADLGIRQAFMITGGGAMHLNDSLGKCNRIKYICNHHEQACAIAGEGYARVTGQPAVVSVTSGPGGVNALNGVYGCWMDSIPLIVISGQIKREMCKTCYGLTKLRQLGDQEADIIGMAKVVTKYAVLVDDPESIRYHLERAVHLARSPRPGPCWLDIPLDIQASQIEPDKLRPYDPAEDRPAWQGKDLSNTCREVIQRIQRSSRPVILAGNGIRVGGAMHLLEPLAKALDVPVATSRTAMDLLPYDFPYYCGRSGIDADRAGNFCVQNADTLLVLGCRLNTRQVGYNWNAYAPEAYKIQVDADELELNKPTVKPDQGICADVKLVMEEMLRQLQGNSGARHAEWVHWCRQRLDRYPGVTDRHRDRSGPLNPYGFLDRVLGRLREDDVVVSANGAAFIMAHHSAKVRRGQRWFFNSGCASMGYDVPAAIGAAVARPGKRVICLAGDGSIQMNIQEFQTIVQHRLPVKILLLNNDGYLSIRTTQTNFFGHLVGESPRSGLTFPDMVKVAGAYGIPACRIEGWDFDEAVGKMLEAPGPALLDVVVDPTQGFEPRMSSKQLPDGRMYSPPLHDMFPFLSREELASNMIIAERSSE